MRKEKFWEMKEEKNRHTVWLTDDAWELVEERYQKDNCSTKNEYIEKAIRFYSGYLDSERAEEYLPRVLAQVLEGKLDAFGKRIGRQMFKQAVDENLMANLVAFYFEMDEDLVRKLRVKCVKNVKETNGEISFLDALRYQKGGERMKGLIQKSGYIQPGSGGEQYVKYIATRDGVERIESTAGDGYLEYMAERPRSHGLFSADGTADLAEMMKEISSHNAPVWTFIYSLRREDAARLGYDTGENWRRLLLAHQTELAAAMKIPPGDFRRCAAFHDEKHHPHIHMLVWSRDPKHGCLTEKEIEKMRSELSGAIFQDELLSLYREKDLSYQQVRDTAMKAMSRLIGEMKTGLCDSPVIAEQMDRLSQMLGNAEGRKVYGYLKKPVKAQVDAIVDELAKLPEAACYEEWNRLRDEVERYYKDITREHQPLSRQKEFRVIKNMAIREAEDLRLGVFTFEDEDMKDEAEEKEEATLREGDSRREMWEIYQHAKEILSERENTEAEKAEQVRALERLWEGSFPAAAHQLGKCWRDGLGCSRMMNRRSCGFAAVPKLVMIFPNTLWAGCWKRRSGWRKQSPGTKKRQLRGIRLPLIGWENCIFRESWFPKMCRKRWSI